MYFFAYVFSQINAPGFFSRSWNFNNTFSDFFEYFLCLEAVTNCSDGGVIGMVPGVIGCLQVSYFFSFFYLICRLILERFRIRTRILICYEQSSVVYYV
jgi:hypothetical protein